MTSILVCARSPLREALVAAIQVAELKPVGSTVSSIEGDLRARLATAMSGEKPSFLLIIQHVEREELRWLSRGRRRFAGEPSSSEVRKRAQDEWSSHPLTFRALTEMAEDDRLSDPELLAAFAAYSVPIVFVGTFDLPKSDETRTVDDLDLFFLDSSIWHRYVNLAHTDGVSDLRRRVTEAKERYERGTYSLSVAVEFLDYSVRALRHLYVIRGPDDGRHGDFVALHGFHSETERAKKTAERPESAWWKARCVLIDDYAVKGLRSAYSAGNGSTKKQLVREALGLEGSRARLLDLDQIEACTNLEEGCVRLGLSPLKGPVKTPVDFVLLDYLLEEKGPDRAKGTDLLMKLGQPESVAPGATILGRYWILPVSSFPTVFEAELRRGKASNVERNYFLAPGADPVCTPELFRFRVWDLLRVMQQHANLGIEALQGPIGWAAEVANRDSHQAQPQSETWLMAFHSLLSRRRESFDQVESDAKSGSLFASALCAQREEWIADVLDALDLLLDVLHYVLWGGSLSQLEALDRLDLVRATIGRIADSKLQDDWSRLEPHLEGAIIPSTSR